MIIYSSYKIKNNKLTKNWMLISLNLTFSSIGKITYSPFISILLSIFPCKNDVVYILKNMECNSNLHKNYKIISIIILTIYIPSNILFIYCYIHLIKNRHQKFTKRTSFPDVYMYLLNVIFCLFYCLKINFFNGYTLFIGTILSIFIFFQYFYYKPICDEYPMKLTLIKVSIFAFTNILLNFLYFSRKYNFNGGMVIFFIGIIFIITYYLIPISDTFEMEEILKLPYNVNNPTKYCLLLEILSKILLNIHKKRNEYLFLETYINYHNVTCLNKKNCELKKYLESDYKDFFFAYQHINILFKYGINKWKNYIRIHLLYVEFLFKNMEKINKAKRVLFSIKENCNTSFLDDFYIFQLEKMLEGNINLLETNSTSLLTEMQFINKKNIFIQNIKDAIVNYILFWNLLLSSHKDITHGLGKLTDIGNKISKLNDKIKKNYSKLFQANSKDKSLITMYNLYKYEILNFKKYIPYNQDNINQENNSKFFLFKENSGIIEIIENNRQSKILIISANFENFCKIINVSLSTCLFFGLTKEELIGKSLSILIPDFIFKPHNDVMLSFSNEFYQKRKYNGLNKNKLVFQNLPHFGINKARMLVCFYMDIIFHYDENGHMSFILKLNDIRENDDNNYILTNSDFHIENFSVNGIKNLGLKRKFINGNIDIFNHINQFHEDYINKIVNSSHHKKISSLQLKKEIISVYMSGNKIINWTVQPVKANKFFQNSMSILKKFPKFDITKFSNLDIQHNNNTNKMENINKNIINDNNNVDTKQNNLTQILKAPLSETFLSEFHFSKKMNSSGFSDTQDFNRNTKFRISIKEIKFKEKTFAYVFILKEYQENSNSSIMENSENQKIRIIQRMGQIKENEEEIEFDFNKNYKIKSPNKKDFLLIEKGFNEGFLPKKNNKFIIDIQRRKYIQIKNNDENIKKNYREEIQKAALKKVNEINKIYKNSDDEEEEEEDDEEDEEDSEISNSNNEKAMNIKMIKTIKAEIKRDSIQNKNQNELKPLFRKRTTRSSKRNNEIISPRELYIKGKYYEIKYRNIHYFVFDFNKGTPIEINGTEFMKSQVLKRIEDENHDIITPKIFKKIDSKNNKKILFRKSTTLKNELITQVNKTYVKNVLSKEMLQKQIEYAIKKQDTQRSVYHIKLISYIIIFCLLIEIISLILFLYYWLNDIDIHLKLIKEANSYFSYIIFSSHAIRELTLLSNENYTNYWGNKTYYSNFYKNLLSIFYQNLIESSHIVSSLISYIESSNFDKIFRNSVEINFLDGLNENLIINGTYSGVQSYFESCLHIITRLDQNSIIPLNMNVYFFLSNSFNVISDYSENEFNIYEKELFDKYKQKLTLMLIMLCFLYIVNILLFILFKNFFVIIIEKRESYIEIFYLINPKLISESLEKCEKFLQKLNIKKSNFENIESISMTSSSSFKNENESLKDEKNNLLDFNINLMNKDDKTKNKSKNSCHKYSYSIWGFMIILTLITMTLFVVIQFLVHKNYKDSLKLTKNVITQELTIVMLYNMLREFIFDNTKTLKGINYGIFLENQLTSFYLNIGGHLKEIEKLVLNRKDLMKKYETIFYGNLCSNNSTLFFKAFMPNKNCSTFAGNCVINGLKQVIFYSIENIRYIYSQHLVRKKIIEQYNFKYNLTLNGFKNNEELLWPKNSSLNNLYFYSHPINDFNLKEFKELNYLLLFVIYPYFSEFYLFVRENSFFSKKNLMILFLSIGCIVIVIEFFVFFIIWKRYELELNNNIFKTKKMLSIIPIETLIYVKNINKLLGIEENKQFDNKNEVNWK